MAGIPHVSDPLKKDRLQLISLVALIGFLFAVVVYYGQAIYRGVLFPHNTFLFDPTDRFADFFNIITVVRHLDPYYETAGMFGNYFPFAYVFMYPFSLIPASWHPFYWFAGLAAGLFVLWLSYYFLLRQVHTRKLDLFTWFPVVILLMSYPVLITLDRGNLELYVFGCCALFLLLFQKKKYLAASISLSLAIAMKLYPAVFLIFLLSERKYRQCFVVCLSAIVLSVGALLLFPGTIISNIEGLQLGLKWYNANYLEFINSSLDIMSSAPRAVFEEMRRFSAYPNFVLDGINYNGSYFSVLRAARLLGYLKISLEWLLTPYLIGTVVVFGAVSGYVIWFEKERWKKIALLVASMILLPYISADYKLIHLFLPLVLFAGTPTRSRFDTVYAVLFGLLLIPKTYFTTLQGINLNSLLNIVLMTALCGLIIYDRFVPSGHAAVASAADEVSP